MILVVGLGNPGPRYAPTRHNAGFMLIDALASGRVAAFQPRFAGDYAELQLGAARVGLLKPGTFMNESGRSVRAASSFFELAPEAVLVVHDELDLALGELRLKVGGGDGGHRGLRSISAELASPEYARLRLGIGRPAPDFTGSVADFVLQAFALEERTELASVLGRASEAVELVVSDGLSRAMNRTNQRMVR
ncbi:MAG TPA: aminoacyl-tRNA hydrolase [Polyangiaceae bacterium]|nr:aminoacyl-tRNA hydrolase [Polyangiaceae bacterium]